MNILVVVHIYLTDFKAKWIKSEINKYKINNNNTNTKLNMKAINMILTKTHFKCKLKKNDMKKQPIFVEISLYETVWSLSVMPSLLPHVLWGRSYVSLFFASVVSPVYISFQKIVIPGLTVLKLLSRSLYYVIEKISQSEQCIK
jgi:hypothetical protein